MAPGILLCFSFFDNLIRSNQINFKQQSMLEQGIPFQKEVF